MSWSFVRWESLPEKTTTTTTTTFPTTWYPRNVSISVKNGDVLTFWYTYSEIITEVHLSDERLEALCDEIIKRYLG